MQVRRHTQQLDLFVPTAEEIYHSVFLNLQLRSKRTIAVERVTVRYRAYVNSTGILRVAGSTLAVSMSETLRDAPPDIVESLAWILVSKLFRRKPPEDMRRRFAEWLNRHEVRTHFEEARRVRGRKFLSGPHGKHFDLDEMFDRINASLFAGRIDRPALSWSQGASKTTLGHYDSAHHAIVMSRALDRPGIPVVLVEYVLFHEILHIKHPVEHEGHRRRIHTREFKREEKTFPHLKEAKEALKRFCSGSAWF
jgi:hypothetical protein